jgi:hypothetical protein
MKLIKLVKLKTGVKKYQAIFKKPDGKEKKTSFGARGYDDYTIKKDKVQRERYRKRHTKDLKTKDPTRAGYLSFYILWGDSTSIQTNLKAYKKRFNL